MKRKLFIQPIHWLYKGISLYIFFFIPMLLIAQQSSLNFCATENITTDNSIYSFSDNISDLNSFPERTFNVYFWDIQTDEGGSQPRLYHEDFIRNIDNLNNVYANSKICFNLKGYGVIRKTEYEHYNPIRINNIINYAKSIGKHMDNAINIYLFRAEKYSGIAGNEGLGVGKWQFKNNPNSEILNHEIGHFLGLVHTFIDWTSTNCERMTRDENDPNFNAKTNGDGIVDTNPVPDFAQEQYYYGVKALATIGITDLTELSNILNNENGFSGHPRVNQIENALLNYGFTQSEVNHLKSNRYKQYAYIDLNTCKYIGFPRANYAMFKNCEGIPFITMITENDVRNIMGYTKDCGNFLSIGQSIRMHEKINSAINQNCSAYDVLWCENIVNALNDYDLYVKNSVEDIGLEPDVNSEHYLWESPDIWVRNQNDGLTNQEHQNPVYKTTSPNYIYVKITNRSCSDYDGLDADLELTWSKTNVLGSVSMLMRNHIDDTGHFDNVIDTKSIPAIPAGESTIITFEWYPPNPNTFIARINELHSWNYSLFAKINSPSDLLFNTSMFNFTHNNNNIAALNVGIVNVSILPEEFIPGGTIAIGNYQFENENRTFHYEFKNLNNLVKEELWKEAEIIITMDNISWSKWTNGGYLSENIEIFNEKNKQIIITDNNAVLKNMNFKAGEWSVIHVGFNFLTQKVIYDEFYYNVFQLDAETNNTIGSATFKIIRNPRELFKAEADYSWSNIENAYILKANDIKESAEYNWYDENGELVFSSPEVILPVDASDKYKLEVISEHDRYKDYDVIDVKNLYGITSISPNPSSDHVKITCKIPQIEDGKSFIKITSLNGTNSKTYSINKDDTLIDVSSYTTGVYLVSLIYEDNMVDTKNLIIK